MKTEMRSIALSALATIALTATPALYSETLPHLTVISLCDKSDAVIEGLYLGQNTVEVVRQYKGEDRWPESAETEKHTGARSVVRSERFKVQIEGLDNLSRRPGFSLSGSSTASPIRTNRVFLFLEKSFDGSLRPLFMSGQGSGGVFWCKEAECFGYRQFVNPGPYFLSGSSLSGNHRIPGGHERMRQEIELGLEILGRWQSIETESDPDKKARQLSMFLLPSTAPYGYAGELRGKLRRSLSGMGEEAVPALLERIEAARDDESLDEVVLILHDIGSPNRRVVAKLNDLLKAPGKTTPSYIVSAIEASRPPSVSETATLSSLD